MVTVVMATRNGAGWIAQTLASLARLVSPADGWSLIVVDSASTDATAAVVAGFADRLPLRLLRSPTPGKNAALNLALAHVEGELIAFTDDDVIADPNWLASLAAAAASEPKFAVFGGAITPIWPREPEPWLLDWVPLGLAFSVTAALPRGECGPRGVWGPNMAVRRSVFRGGLRFDESIGPNGSARYAMGSETSFTRRLAARGQRCFHAPEAVVGHMIRPQQMTREFVLARAYRGGRGKGMLAQELEPAATLATVPRYFLRQAAEAAVRFGLAELRGDEAASFQAAWQWNFALGCISGARTAAASAAPRQSHPRFAGAPSQSVAI